jgi:hypothetical protein
LQPFVDKLPPQAMPIVLKNSPLPESTAKELGDSDREGRRAARDIPPELQQADDRAAGKQRIAELEQENAEIDELKDSAVVPAVIAALGALLLETADHLLLEDGSLLLLG